MSIINSIWRSNILIRLRSWEYWPFWVIYAPLFFYWLWLSLKARSLLYFTASNPAIENGGMLGESKIKILDMIPVDYKPKTIIVEPFVEANAIISLLNESNLTYPVICKPDVGERGYMVEKVINDQQLEMYLKSINVPFLVQEFIDLPLEMGVFYYRYPNEDTGMVSSIVIKEMLTITGDGISTVQMLILQKDRAKLQWHALRKKHHLILDKVLEKGEKLELMGIGNHSRGTKFLNGNKLINDTLHKLFDEMSHQVKDFYFGRYDIRVASIEDLYRGNIFIMELNGAGSEPAHIYEPGFSLCKAYKVLLHHWRVLYDISIRNHRKGIPYLSFSEGWKEYRKLKN